MFRCDRTADGRSDPLHIRQRCIFVDRIVTNHYIRFADENGWAEQFVPKLRPAGHMRNNHLTHAAIFGVFLGNNEPARFAHGFFNRSAIPRHD